MTLKVYRENDADIHLIQKKTIGIIGYGSQGRAQALNLKDSGVNVLVGLRETSQNIAVAKKDGFAVQNIEAVVQQADVVVILAPDEAQVDLYDQRIAPHLRAGQTLMFAHGFAVHYGYINPPKDIDVVMVVAKSTGVMVRKAFEQGSGVPCFIAVHQDISGKAKKLSLAYAMALGGGRSAVMETTFKDECEANLFGEQAILFGGLDALIRASFETLIEAGYPEELAYFECSHQVKLVADLIHYEGLAQTGAKISNTAEYGGYVAGPRIIDQRVKQNMKAVLTDVQNGSFAEKWIDEQRAGSKKFLSQRAQNSKHPIEQVGAKIRSLMPWSKK